MQVLSCVPQRESIFSIKHTDRSSSVLQAASIFYYCRWGLLHSLLRCSNNKETSTSCVVGNKAWMLSHALLSSEARHLVSRAKNQTGSCPKTGCSTLFLCDDQLWYCQCSFI